MRILGKGKTANAIKKIYDTAILYDDSDKSSYDIDSKELTIVSPGIPPSNYMVKQTKKLLSDYDLFLKDKFTIWISGTNGKTTTTKMVDLLLKDSGFYTGGNIGTPLADISQYDKLILETSSFTLHYTNIAIPNIYVLLNISEDHITWHGSFQEYENAKLKPLGMMEEEGIVIVPSKYKNIKTKAKLISFDDTKDLAQQFDIDISKLKFDEPFLLDAVIALVVEKLVKKTVSYTLLNSFIQDPHKLEIFLDHKKRIWIDDSKATNIDATIQAIKSYKNKKIYLILGGDDKGADLTPLFELLKGSDTTIFTIGSNQNKLKTLAQKYGIVSFLCNTLENAVKTIDKNWDTGAIAILSPSAASLDQFDSYKHRGEMFKSYIKGL